MQQPEKYPEVITQSSPSPGSAPPRSFEDSLRELILNSPYLLVSLGLHAVIVILVLMGREAPVIVDEVRSIVATTTDAPPEIVPPEPLPELPPEEPDEPLDDPTVIEDEVLADASDFTDPLIPASLEDSPSAVGTIGLGSGRPTFGDRNSKINGPGRREDPGRPFNASVDAALLWLAAHQDPEGYWSANAFDDRCGALGINTFCTGRGLPTVDVGVTSLALLAFLGAGHTDQSGKHRQTVKRGLRWLIENQDRGGNFAQAIISEHSYDHSIATLAVLESAALSRNRPQYKRAAQRGIDYLHTLRNPGAAWRYGDAASDDMQLHANDVSVTGWALMVLTLAKEQGLRVDPRAIEDALVFIEEMTDASGRTGYVTRGGSSSRRPGDEAYWPAKHSEAMTAVAMLSRVFADPMATRPETEPRLRQASEILSAQPIVWSDKSAAVGRRDFYYWYYASYALFQLGGEEWARWRPGIEQIAAHQVKEGEMRGSWDPEGDPWGADGGRVYSTALLALTLEVFYRYDTVLGARKR